MNEFPEFLYFPIAPYVNDFMALLLQKFGTFFDQITLVILNMLMVIEKFLLWLPWWSIIIAVLYLGWKSTKSWITAAVMALLLVMVGSFGMWELMMQTLDASTFSVTIPIIVLPPNLSSCLGMPIREDSPAAKIIAEIIFINTPGRPAQVLPLLPNPGEPFVFFCLRATCPGSAPHRYFSNNPAC
jgi:ABC-type proline/glycine betaine transport system permease subunit